MKLRTCLWIAAITLVAVGCQSDQSASNTPTDTNKPSNENTTPTANEGSNPATPPANETPPATTVSFTTIQGVMKEKCVGCHGVKGVKAGVNLTSYDNVMKGGEHGAIVKAGDPDNSRLIWALRGTHGIKRMPMMADPLPEDTIKAVEAWIKDGAKSS